MTHDGWPCCVPCSHGLHGACVGERKPDPARLLTPDEEERILWCECDCFERKFIYNKEKT